MEQLQKLEERLRKEGLPHTVHEESYSYEGGRDEIILHVLSYPNNTRPIVSFIFRNNGTINMFFGPWPFVYDVIEVHSHYCRDIYQAHDIIIGLFNALNS